jgi:hypothetical protein
VTALLRRHGVSSEDALAERPNLGPLLATTEVSEEDDLASSDGVRHRTFDAVRDLLNDLSRASPVVLVIDDLQWADAPTLLLTRPGLGDQAREASRACTSLSWSTGRHADHGLDVG